MQIERNVVKLLSLIFCMLVFFIVVCDGSVFIIQIWFVFSFLLLLCCFFVVPKFKYLNGAAKKLRICVLLCSSADFYISAF